MKILALLFLCSLNLIAYSADMGLPPAYFAETELPPDQLPPLNATDDPQADQQVDEAVQITDQHKATASAILKRDLFNRLLARLLISVIQVGEDIEGRYTWYDKDSLPKTPYLEQQKI